MGLENLIGKCWRTRVWSCLTRQMPKQLYPLQPQPPKSSLPSSSATAANPDKWRYFSAVPEGYAYDHDRVALCWQRDLDMQNEEGGLVPQAAEKARYISIRAYFLCTSINLKSMLAENADCVVPPTSRSTNYVAFRYCKQPPISLGTSSKEVENSFRYMVVFQYGSAVLFNVPDHETDDYLDVVRKHATGLVPEMRREEYAVVEKPVLETWMQGGPDHIILKNLDTDGIRIIGSVLGQSIALDYFINQVDHMVEEFNDINRDMERTGTFTMERKKLFQLVGKANSNLGDVIIKLGLLDRSEIAWRNANYAQILEYLSEEFELSQRFGGLDFKLKFVEHNIHFLHEVLEKRRSELLEWGVIVLLTIDNLLLVYGNCKNCIHWFQLSKDHNPKDGRTAIMVPGFIKGNDVLGCQQK